MQLQEEKESKVHNKFQWVIFAGVIPLLFAVTVALVVLSVAGVNVFDAAEKYGPQIPGVSSFFKDETATIDIEKQLQKDIADLESVNKEYVSSIEKLEQEVEGKDTEITSLKEQVLELQEEMMLLEEQQHDTRQSLKEISSMYESMSSKNAASILTELNEQEALKIIRNLSTDSLSSILEKMDPKEAAKFTEMLTLEAEVE